MTIGEHKRQGNLSNLNFVRLEGALFFNIAVNCVKRLTLQAEPPSVYFQSDAQQGRCSKRAERTAEVVQTTTGIKRASQTTEIMSK